VAHRFGLVLGENLIVDVSLNTGLVGVIRVTDLDAACKGAKAEGQAHSGLLIKAAAASDVALDPSAYQTVRW